MTERVTFHVRGNGVFLAGGDVPTDQMVEIVRVNPALGEAVENIACRVCAALTLLEELGDEDAEKLLAERAMVGSVLGTA